MSKDASFSLVAGTPCSANNRAGNLFGGRQKIQRASVGERRTGKGSETNRLAIPWTISTRFRRIGLALFPNQEKSAEERDEQKGERRTGKESETSRERRAIATFFSSYHGVAAGKDQEKGVFRGKKG